MVVRAKIMNCQPAINLTRKACSVVAGIGGLMEVNLVKGNACCDNFHAGYFIRYIENWNKELIN